MECDAVVSGSNAGIVGGMFGALVRVLARDSLLLVGCTIDRYTRSSIVTIFQ